MNCRIHCQCRNWTKASVRYRHTRKNQSSNCYWCWSSLITLHCVLRLFADFQTCNFLFANLSLFSEGFRRLELPLCMCSIFLRSSSYLSIELSMEYLIKTSIVAKLLMEQKTATALVSLMIIGQFMALLLTLVFSSLADDRVLCSLHNKLSIIVITV